MTKLVPCSSMKKKRMMMNQLMNWLQIKICGRYGHHPMATGLHWKKCKYMICFHMLKKDCGLAACLILKKQVMG